LIIPSSTKETNNAVPPYEKSGNGIPVTGKRPMFIPKLITN